MGEQPQPRRNPVLEALLGLLLSVGVLPVEFLAVLLSASLGTGSSLNAFWVFFLVGLVYFGVLFWLAIRKRRSILPGLIIGAALWSLLSTACYQLVNM